MGRTKPAYVVILEINNRATGDQTIEVFGTFFDRMRAGDLAAKLRDTFDAEMRGADSLGQVWATAYVRTIASAPIRTAQIAMRRMLLEEEARRRPAPITTTTTKD